MGIEVVTVQVGGRTWTAIKSIEVTASFNDASRSFSFIAAAEAGPSGSNAIFSKGAEIKIAFNGDVVLTGNINRRQPRMKAKDRFITVSGRSKSADFVDGAAEHDKGHFENKDPLEIAKEITKNYAPQWETDQQLEKLDIWRITPGETAFRAVEKMLRQQGMTITGTAEGNAKITKAGSKRHSGGLFEGENIVEGSADHNESNQHSEYTVLGQRAFGHGVDNIEIAEIAKDSSVKRHKPVIVVQDDDTTKDKAKKRAKTRKDRAAGDALKAEIQVQGFRDEGGKVWEPGYLIWTESEFLDIAQDMLLESVTFNQSDAGSLATLSLTDPKSYGGSSGGGNKSGSEWSSGGDE